MLKDRNSVKPIALYLPQFHPIPENDIWWGKGFTEWTNVTRSKPKFNGHYQPHLPADLGFYDLRLLDTHIAQARMAKDYGIYGFCYYHYWFNGELLLEKPLELVLNHPEIGMPFCLCWANENWSRRWDGQEKDILKEQKYSLEDDYHHIQYLIPFFKEERYMKIDGKPVFLIYRSELHPEINDAVNIWRNETKKAGFPDLYLIRVENFQKQFNPSQHGFDAGLEFAPDNFDLGQNDLIEPLLIKKAKHWLHKRGLRKDSYFENKIYTYKKLIDWSINKSLPDYPYFRSVCPSWDNSPRRDQDAFILRDSSPELFEQWLKAMAEDTGSRFKAEERFLFINAWNEWGEGCHLEPDQKWGKTYLEVVKRVLSKL